MKLCVFCGTFNPIHNVHLAMANYVRNHFNFDMILFIPAYKPPHKQIDDERANHRYNMVKLAISGESKFNISSIEFRHEKYSYTVNTIKELYNMYPNIEGKISFIIGTDAFLKIEDWHQANVLKTLVKFLVFPREEKFNPKQGRIERLRENGYEFDIVNMPFINLSSTVLRSRIRNEKSIGSLIPESVHNYIEKNGLYVSDENSL